MDGKRICKYKDCNIELRDGEKKYCPEHELRKKSLWNKIKFGGGTVGAAILAIILWPVLKGGNGDA
ncbi:MAG: hypothetical protein SCARUB_00511 [Candidatus Scalindua rubra]|uniref:Uncharacterized protein n=1 Tax=Candidatus Scalindua rubra TaxID=1872076 RepID=A0A1E3XFK6_9BACT|nr:MAG: hypothetical protein SCARUB_00511 [Candidatus Scalindua rubra]